MPFYEYQCRKCGYIMDLLQPMGTDEPPACDKCGNAETKKVMSATGAVISQSPASAPACGTAPSCSGCSSANACDMAGMK